ncbi:MAG: Asp-tRNA(Asn)/Glu-tRNA(Gln) amidotransferase subunit GatC [Bacteroidota bacterium]|jgi:aspartyl-tRNA(Asn)/glutamyl-tRNA(Gln) amidotransferase subunit C
MDISNEMIDKLADLSKLEFNGDEKEKLKADLNKIITFIDKLNELDTKNVEPLIFMSNEVNMLREDEVKQTITHEEAMLNAPSKDSDYFRVTKFLEK